MTSSAWGFSWGSALWGSGTEWSGATGDLEVLPAGELDHVQTALDRLWKQFEGLPNWIAIMEVFGQLVQEVEGVLAQVSSGRFVRNAQGVQLDEIAAMVGTARGAFTDDELFRLAVIVDARTLISSTTAPEILELARAIGPNAETVRLWQLFPSSLRLTISDLTPAVFVALLTIFADLPGAGKNMLLETYDSAMVGGWDSTTGGTTPPLGAWASTTGPTASIAPWSNAAALQGQ